MRVISSHVDLNSMGAQLDFYIEWTNERVLYKTCKLF